jgi:hypothetical protein
MVLIAILFAILLWTGALPFTVGWVSFTLILAALS